MTDIKKFHGVFVPVVTIYNEDGSICATRTGRFIDYLISDCGVHGIFCPGSTGDYTLVSLDERRDLIRLAVETAAGRVPVLAGSGHNATHIALELSQYAASVGADGVLVSLPHYPRPTQQGLYEHFRTLGKALSIPVMVYNYPAGMGIDIDLDTICRLTHDGAIAGIKDSIDGGEGLGSLARRAWSMETYVIDSRPRRIAAACSSVSSRRSASSASVGGLPSRWKNASSACFMRLFMV